MTKRFFLVALVLLGIAGVLAVGAVATFGPLHTWGQDWKQVYLHDPSRETTISLSPREESGAEPNVVVVRVEGNLDGKAELLGPPFGVVRLPSSFGRTLVADWYSYSPILLKYEPQGVVKGTLRINWKVGYINRDRG